MEGFEYTKGEKIEYTMPIRATMRGIPVEITAWTIQQAMEIEGTRIPPIPKASEELDKKYITLLGLTRADHNTDGTWIRGFTEEYMDRIKALVEIMCVKKKSQYAFTELLENLY